MRTRIILGGHTATACMRTTSFRQVQKNNILNCENERSIMAGNNFDVGVFELNVNSGFSVGLIFVIGHLG